MSAWPVGKENWNEVRNMILFQNNRVNSLLYFFVTPDEIQCSSLYTNQALHSLLIHMHLLISGYLLRTPDNSNFFFPVFRRFELSWVDCISLFIFHPFIRNAGWMIRIFFHTSLTEMMGRKSWRLSKTWWKNT